MTTFLTTGEPVNAVNLPPVSAEVMTRLRPFQALARRLGRLLGVLADKPLDRLEVTLAGGPEDVGPSQVAVAALVGLLADRFDVPVNQVNVSLLAQSVVPPEWRVLGPAEGFPQTPSVSLVLARPPVPGNEAVDSLAQYVVEGFRDAQPVEQVVGF